MPRWGVNPKITKITQKRPFWTHHTSYMTDLKIYSQTILQAYNTACVKIIHAPFNLLLEGHFFGTNLTHKAILN